MNILALDTSMGACSAAILSGKKLFVRQKAMTRGHAEALLPMMAETMAEAGVTPAALEMIAATTGPGSFTGVRIAIAAARGLAVVTDARLFGADSLTVMAKVALTEGLMPEEPYAVAVDARRGMLYLGLYDAAGRKLDGPLLIAPDDAVPLLPRELRFAVGSGAGLLAEAAARHGRAIEPCLPELQPSASALAGIASQSGETMSTLKPLYLRPPDAKPQAQAMERS